MRPGTPGYSYLYSARQIAERENVHFGAVSGLGIQRITHEEVVMGSSAGISRMRKTARRLAKRITRVNFDSLTSRAKQIHNTNLTIFRLGELFSKPSLVKQIESKVKDTSGPLAIEDTLKMFKK